jgi:WXXGXW repeat (2 copies)
MKMNIVDRAEKKAVSARNGTKTIRKWPVLLLLLLLPVTFGLSGCEDEYYGGARPGYGPYYGDGYGPGYAGRPGYGPYPGAVTVEIGDRPYYNRGAGYYVGRSYYVWRPGHWVRRNGQRVWIHGHYVVRG